MSFIGPFIANDFTGSARMVQLAGVALWSAVRLGGLIGGWVSDRFDRRRMVIIQFLITIPGLIILGVAELSGALRLWMIYPVLFLTGVGWVFDMVGRRVIVYDVVGPEKIDNALALESSGTAVAGLWRIRRRFAHSRGWSRLGFSCHGLSANYFAIGIHCCPAYAKSQPSCSRRRSSSAF